MLSFYTAEDLRREKRKRNIAVAVCALAALAGLSVCLWLLLTAGTLTAERNELTVYCVNAAAGAFVLGIWLNAVSPARRALSHFAAVTAGEPEPFPYTDGLMLSETPERVPGGVRIYRVTAVNGSGTCRFFVYAPYAEALRRAGERGALQTANGYITGVLPEGGGDGA